MADSMKGAAERVWNMLDRMAESNPEEYKSFINQQLKDGAEIFSPPQPAFCLRSSLKQSTAQGDLGHLFINVCKWDRVPKPKTDSDPVAVKGGILRHPTVDGKRAANDALIDVAFNPSVLDECQKDDLLFNMLTSLILDFVADLTPLDVDRTTCVRIEVAFRGSKEDIWYALDEQWRHLLSTETQLDVRSALLNHLKHCKKGAQNSTAALPSLKLHSQTKQYPERCHLIEEILTDVTDIGNGSTNKARLSGLQPALEHSIYIKEVSGHPRRVVVKVSLPAVESASQIGLEVFKYLSKRKQQRQRTTQGPKLYRSASAVSDPNMYSDGL